ncbi:hypothetical protein KIN20_017800 [Parelaphostrongylus tenuis]|uniref:Uncharacterized protein n=1 Tax=Parelaphostrongylus tenuis TaxID=148309 RepID=A0AAD5N6Q8_PARTN|nr:hypothetical protein KIN20_017800 [Parelaphostrongylus tenuis]
MIACRKTASTNPSAEANAQCKADSPRPWIGNGIAEVRGPQAENGPNGEGGIHLPPKSSVSSIAGHHPNGLLTSPGPTHIK